MPVLTLQNANSAPYRAKALVFEDPKSRALLARLNQIAPSDATVLITGETGTGKEIIARQIHEQSARANKPFVAMNCGALAPSVAESELFGHERGAFTGALNTKPGWFEAASDGSLFLDEIGELPLALQVKLLRVLQEGEVVRVGARQPVRVDVRLIAATNVNLEEAVASGQFREDLYYRLSVAPLVLPPLRERQGDILPLALYFLANYAKKLEAGRVKLTPAAEQCLLAHPWPGNIRELENAIHHALLVGHGEFIEPSDLKLVTRPERTQKEPDVNAEALTSFKAALNRLFELQTPNLFDTVEETLVRDAYDYCERNQLQTARLLGTSRNIIRARLIEYGELQGSPRSTIVSSSDASAESSARSSSTIKLSARTLRIGYQRFGLLPLVKAHGALDAAFAARGYRIEWHEFPGGIQLVEAFASNKLSLGAVGEGPPIFAYANRIPIVYLAAEGAAPEDEAILVPLNSPIQSVRDLRGRAIALNRGANVHYLVIRALEEAGLEYDDVRVVYLPPVEARAAFQRRNVDAWAIWSPFLGELLASGEARSLVDGRGLVDNAVHYIASPEFVETHPTLAELFFSQLAGIATSIAPHRVPRRIDETLIQAQQRVADTFYRHKLIPTEVQLQMSFWRPPQKYEALWQLFGKEETA